MDGERCGDVVDLAMASTSSLRTVGVLGTSANGSVLGARCGLVSLDEETTSKWGWLEEVEDDEEAGRGEGDWLSGGGVGVVECVCETTMCDGEIMLLILWSVDRLVGDEKSTLGARIELVSVVNGCSVGW